MKNIFKSIIFTTIMFAVLLATSCDSSDNWEPGPLPLADNPGVYFDQNTPSLINAMAEDGVLLENYIEVKVGRDDFKASTALSVPLIHKIVSPLLKVPATVEFEAGQVFTQLRIEFNAGYEVATPYELMLEIHPDYQDPYKEYAEGEEAGTPVLTTAIQVVSPIFLGNVTFEAKDFEKATSVVFHPFETELWDNFDGTYTFKNFLMNNKGHDFTFRLDGTNIEPVSYPMEHANRWYFYSGEEGQAEDTSEFRITCHIPNDHAPDHYIRYLYFYDSRNTSSYQNFWLDLDKGEGKMTNYSRWSTSATSSGRFTFHVSWDPSEVQ